MDSLQSAPDLFSLRRHPEMNPEASATPLTVYGVVRKESWKKSVDVVQGLLKATARPHMGQENK